MLRLRTDFHGVSIYVVASRCDRRTTGTVSGDLEFFGLSVIESDGIASAPSVLGTFLRLRSGLRGVSQFHAWQSRPLPLSSVDIPGHITLGFQRPGGHRMHKTRSAVSVQRVA